MPPTVLFKTSNKLSQMKSLVYSWSGTQQQMLDDFQFLDGREYTIAHRG